MANHPTTDQATPTKFGTFGGVFTPCKLTILGVIMFLRIGQVVGQSGIFYFAQAISVAMYVIGFTEAFSETFAYLAGNFLMIASLTNLIVFVCVYIGAGWTIKVQYMILAILFLAIGSFYAGALAAFNPKYHQDNFSSIVLGALNGIAPIITMFFMITNGMLNLATFMRRERETPVTVRHSSLAIGVFPWLGQSVALRSCFSSVGFGPWSQSALSHC